MPTLTVTLPTGATVSRTTTAAYRVVVAGRVRHSGAWEVTWTKGTAEQAESSAARERDVREWTVNGRVGRGFTPRGAIAAFRGGRNADALIAQNNASPTYYDLVVVVPVCA